MKKNLLLTLILTLCYFFQSCIKGGEHTIHGKVQNNSGVTVKIFPIGYPNLDTIALSNGASTILPYIAGQGFVKEATTKDGIAFRLTIGGKLSFVFNGKDTVVHYNDTLPHTGKYVNKTSNRCAFNDNSHAYFIDKYSAQGYYKLVTYTVTADDYEFAKR